MGQRSGQQSAGAERETTPRGWRREQHIYGALKAQRPEHAGISRNRATRNRKSEMWLCDTCSEAQSVPAHLAEAAGVITAL